LNVSRESLQSNRFLKQLRQIILKRIIRLFTEISEGQDQEKIDKMQETYGSVLKLGAVEDIKNRDKLAGLTRFTTNQRNNTSFDQVCLSSRMSILYTSTNYSLQVFGNEKKRTEAGVQITFATSGSMIHIFPDLLSSRDGEETRRLSPEHIHREVRCSWLRSSTSQ